jgi:hypothetical protein
MNNNVKPADEKITLVIQLGLPRVVPPSLAFVRVGCEMGSGYPRGPTQNPAQPTGAPWPGLY